MDCWLSRSVRIVRTAHKTQVSVLFQLAHSPHKGTKSHVHSHGDGKDGSIGLTKLVAAVLGRRMEKAQQMSPWQRRPLSMAQQQYAALDAHVLLLIADRLLPQVASLGKDPMRFPIHHLTLDHQSLLSLILPLLLLYS